MQEEVSQAEKRTGGVGEDTSDTPAPDEPGEEEVFALWLPSSAFVSISAPEESARLAGVEPEKGADVTFLVLWLVAIALFGFGDTFTSALAFSRGAYEANRLLAAIVRLLGGSMVSFVLLKTGVLMGLLLVSSFWASSSRWFIPALTSAVGGYLVANNLLSYFLRP